jgi:hypothetical protein
MYCCFIPLPRMNGFALLKAIRSITKLLTADSISPAYYDGMKFNNNDWTNYNVSIYIQVGSCSLLLLY